MKQFCLIALAGLLQFPLPASAQFSSEKQTLDSVGIDQNLGRQLPTGLSLTDDSGRRITLQSLLRGRPVILELVYFNCPMLCTQSLNGLQRSMNALAESAGETFDVWTVSFDANETPALAAAKKQSYLKGYPRPRAAESWHFLTGDSDAIRRLTDVVGFRYHWDVRTRSFAHTSALIVLTPTGKISRYLFGVEYDPTDLHQALITGQNESAGPVAEQVFLYCLRYDAASGRYSLIISQFLKACAGVTLLALLGFIGLNVVRERRRRVAAPQRGE